ncbi:MAG: Cysteine--tRNA ligase [Chlamydiae bacterium]|nr:Cysteine--tRNA ligase [Chlamydiota bacterium]
MTEAKLTIPKLPVRLFNTESRQKEVFKPLHDNHARIYTCGPTVYHYAHIGNFRTYVFEDLLRRTLKFFGYQVTQVMNITDVDDKTIRGTIEKSSSLNEFTQPYKNAFFVDIQSLGIERAEHYPAATDYIPQMIDFVQKLIDKEFAYKSSDGSVYFSIDKFQRYGRLSRLKLDELVVGARAEVVAHDEYDKENVGDFVLWKAYDAKRDGKVFWESPFGPGRPGWHLECSAMAIALLGETLDIHVGAVDNIFPHHENEIAQSEAFSGKLFVKLWMHSDHLIVNHKKMSKSLGNFFTLRDLLEKGYEGMDVRYMLMHTHYRTQLNFTFAGLDGAKKSLQKLNDFIQRNQEIADSKGTPTETCVAILQKNLDSFAEAMADDLNISAALSHIYDMTHEINALFDGGKMTPGDGAAVVSAMQEFNRVLGVFTFEREDEAPKELQEMLDKRNAARSEKNWALADQMRDEIHKHGYLIEDTAGGTRLKKR